MDWSSLVANGIVGSLLGLYLRSIRRRIDDGKANLETAYEQAGKRFDDIGVRLDALLAEVTSRGKALARIESRLVANGLKKNRNE